MKQLTKIRYLTLAYLFTALLTAGCTALPEAGNVARVTVDEVRNGATADLPVRWGGTIASISNTDEGTVLEVVSRPLRSSGRPRQNDVTHGRFRARVAEFLDPAIVKIGRDITMTGTVAGTEAGTIGESQYRFAVLDVAAYRYWSAVPDRHRHAYGYHPFLYGHDHPGWISDPWHGHRHYRLPARRTATETDVDF